MTARKTPSEWTLPGAQRKTVYSNEWYTPPFITQSLGCFDLDPCAGPSRHAAVNIVAPECGLAAEWKGRVWLNPPYTNVYKWLAKLVTHGDGICLVNARPETKWFQATAQAADAILFLAARVRFISPVPNVRSKPTVGSVLLAFGARNAEALSRSKLHGVLVHPCRSYVASLT